MRRVRYNVAASLDGFIAGPSGEFDWIPADPAVDFAALFARVDTILVGRRTYELTLTGTRVYPSGMVTLSYTVARASVAKPARD